MSTAAFEDTPETARILWDGYKVTMYRSPNSGDMVFDIETPEDFEYQIEVFVNDNPLDLHS